MIDFSWVMDNSSQIVSLLLDHLLFVASSLAIGTAIASAMVLLTLRWPALATPFLSISGLLFTIPSLAMFILLMPFTGLSKTTSVIGLSLYSLLIVLQNVLAGLASNPQDIIEEARALGHTRWQTFIHVELPLAMPAFLAGLRTTAVSLVGLVTVTAIIGQGGLGQLFITGLTLGFTTPVVVSLALTVALALCLDAGFWAVEKAVIRWER